MTLQIYSKAALTKTRAKAEFPPNLRLTDHMRQVSEHASGHRVYEFIGTDSFGTQWVDRQRYEIDAGRDEEPIVYTPVYETVSDGSLPRECHRQHDGAGWRRL